MMNCCFVQQQQLLQATNHERATLLLVFAVIVENTLNLNILVEKLQEPKPS